MAHDKEKLRDHAVPPVRSVDHPGAPPAAREPAPSAAEGVRRRRVLVAEDNPHVVGMYQYALRKLASADGATVDLECAANGHDALNRLATPPRVDLLIADLYMPVLDGFTLVERMKAEASLATIPILIISAGAADARVRALALGVDVYLQKPVQIGDILGTLRTLLRTSA